MQLLSTPTISLGSCYFLQNSYFSFPDPVAYLTLTVPSDNKLEVTYLWRSALNFSLYALLELNKHKPQFGGPMQLAFLEL